MKRTPVSYIAILVLLLIVNLWYVLGIVIENYYLIQLYRSDQLNYTSNGEIYSSNVETELTLQYLLGKRSLGDEEIKCLLIQHALHNDALKITSLSLSESQLREMTLEELSILNFDLFDNRGYKLKEYGWFERRGELFMHRNFPPRLPAIDSRYLAEMMNILQKGGKPRIRLTSQMDDVKGGYTPAKNLITVNLGNAIDQYGKRYPQYILIEEMSHSIQFNDNFTREMCLQLVEFAIQSIGQQLNLPFAKDREWLYKTPYTTEYRAHTNISPNLFKLMGLK